MTATFKQCCCLQLPKRGQPKTSSFFLLMGNEWNIRFIYAHDGYYDAYISPKRVKAECKPFHFDFTIGFQNGESLSLGKGNVEVTKADSIRFWSMKYNILQQKLPSNYYQSSNAIKFELHFYFPKEPISKLFSTSGFGTTTTSDELLLDYSASSTQRAFFGSSYLYPPSSGFSFGPPPCVYGVRSTNASTGLIRQSITPGTGPVKPSEDKCEEITSSEDATSSLSEDLSMMLESGLYHDAEIHCGMQIIKAHRNILSARSEVFKAMLQSNMWEGRTGIVSIQDVDINYIQDFVKYLYTDTLPELTFDKAKTLYEVGDKYAVRSLMVRCSKYLQENLSRENACECLALADAHNDEKLKNRVAAYILETRLYLEDKIWSPFCNQYPKIALDIYKLSHANA